MLKKLTIISLMTISSLGAMLTPSTKQNVKQYRPGVYKDAEGFVFRKRGTETRINTYDVDKPLRNLSTSQFGAVSKYVVATKMNNGEYAVRLKSHLPGGPAGGAAVGWWVGWIGTNVVAKGAIALTAVGAGAVGTLVGGPAGASTFFYGTYHGLNTALQVPIQAAAQKVALAGGILGGSSLPF